MTWEDGPILNAPYAGQTQTSQINVPATIGYKYIDSEESCWVLPPYANLYPPPVIDTSAALPWPAPAGPMESRSVDFLPPPVQKTRLWDAMQVYPL